jgi:hypothetical protein
MPYISQPPPSERTYHQTYIGQPLCDMHERDVSMCLCSRKGQRLGRSECKQQSQGIIPKTVKTVHVARGDTDTSWLTYCIGYRTLLSSLGYFAAWGARYCDLRAVACGHPPVPHTRCYLSSDIIWQPRNGCMLTTTCSSR